MQAALEITQLSKRFGEQFAVNGLNLCIEAGMFYALLGPNGAGKTTTLRMVAGLLQPDGGDIQIFGHSLAQNPSEAKRLLAYLPDDPMLYSKLRPLEYLEFVAGLWSIPSQQAEAKAIELLKVLDLWKVRGDYIESFSRGMKQKLALAGGFIHEPKLIILDEPLTGLDAGAARLVKDMLSDYVKQGNTVILTTHIMEIAERMASRIGIINKGTLIAEGTLAELQARSGNSEETLEDLFLELTEVES